MSRGSITDDRVTGFQSAKHGRPVTSIMTPSLFTTPFDTPVPFLSDRSDIEGLKP